MATTTTAKTVTTAVIRTAKTLTVAADGGARGKRELVLDFVKVDKVELSDVQNQVLDHFVDAGQGVRWGTPYTVEATPDQLKTLVAVKELSEGTAPAAKAPRPVPIDKVTTETVVAGTRRVVHPTTRPAAGTEVAVEATKIAQAQAVIDRLQEPQWLLQYDIPDSSDESNPSWLMWRAGFFRLTKSVWVGAESCTKSPLIETLMSTYREKGIRAYLIPFADSANAQLRELATERLRELLVEIHTSLIRGLSAAHTRYHTAVKQMEEATAKGEEVSSSTQETATNRHVGGVRACLRIAAERLDTAVKFAEMYEQTEQVADLLAALRATLASEAASFNAQARLQNRSVLEMPASAGV